ncbi:DUF6010 family protein [Spirosoma sp. RP8]|uniref:DUF6010 family protein n=1 Tax=Spirosoma liriopis TaxID=2937440 RepID=A0ABT0HT33_9BACT|nr:DUF6010 family protein [Spirosoma liriopis]MCK8495336.1 DUF6010 family protein [Spirosoma liriopis]
MDTHHVPDFTLMAALAAVGIALVYISLSSLLREPNRQRLSAIIVAGAGAAYLSSGLGLWEFGFCSLMTFVAYKGLSNYAYLGIGWLLHTSWDVVHHLYANPIVPFEPSSSAGCAVCDTILALWFFAGAPTVLNGLLAGRTSQGKATAGLGKSEQVET